MCRIHVAAAVIRRAGKVLLASRPAGKPPAGWEFPGGKIEPGETPAGALRRELEEELGVRVLDRSGLILDIFAQRARTKEGCLQVELAQYQYLLPRFRSAAKGRSTAGWSSPVRRRRSCSRRTARSGIF